ncbi:hypothetical protein H2200_013595 [Cladophialophora chaetospira]|uniref:E3 ubiquitin-protein ligase listerin n=1 Tax=Cladophialophora chaetospira TaxID=386627 RepID=A0AA38TX79_9EURO|nr:hypothetical protein H2200_013595 [Cladophialophora chaetospira]
MSKKFKSQASAASARAASAAFRSSSPAFGFGSSASTGFQTAPSSLSYIAEQPDLSAISNANLVVTLRNLGKKDSTTKAKALEELQDYVGSLESGEGIDAGLLEAWINLYPRTSIDNARRVRQLAHTLQGALTASAGKRIAPQLPKVIGAWLSGAYDSDRLVARTAQDSLSTAFNTEDKRRALWKVYRSALVEYANDAILVQSSQTLSDERSTTPDDAEAKFVRVVGNAVQLLSQVIKANCSTDGEVGKSGVGEGIKAIVQERRLWEYSSHQDSTLRKAVCSLVTICASNISEELDWKTISSCFIGKAMHSGQLGSSGQLSEALLTFTSVRPEIWTTDYTSKTAASKRLFQYLRKGSQRGPVGFWSNVRSLIKKIPPAAWATVTNDGKVQLEDATTLLESLRAGVTSNEEPRQNLEPAWSVYAEISFWLTELLVDDHASVKLLDDALLPLITQYIALDPSQNSWDVPTSFSATMSASVLLSMLRRGLYSSFETVWDKLTRILGDSMKLSLPESSKDFAKSQDSVIAQARRLFKLRSLVLQAPQLSASEMKHAVAVIRRSGADLVNVAIELLKARNGRPYGAASVLEILTLTTDIKTSESLESFLASNAVDLLDTPSSEYLVSLFLHTGQNPDQVFTKLIRSWGNTYAAKALSRLLGTISEEVLLRIPEVEQFIIDQILTHLEDEAAAKALKGVLQNPKLASSALHKSCCQHLIAQLSPSMERSSQLATLRFLLSLLGERISIPSLSSDDMPSTILSKLLLLSDSDDPETTELASSLLAKLKTTPTGPSSATASSTTLIADQLSGKGDPLSVFVLVDLARDVLKTQTSQPEGLFSTILPTASQWDHALENHLLTPPPVSLSITSPLRGLISIITPTRPTTLSSFRDSDGFSLLYRLVLYVTKMMFDTDLSIANSEEHRRALYIYYPLALQILNEKLTMEAANELWFHISEEILEEAAEALSQGHSIVQKWMHDDQIRKVWVDVLRSTDSLAPNAYYHGLAFTDVASRFADEHGPTMIISEFEAETKNLHRADEVVQSAALIATCRDYLLSSQQGRKLLNELVAAVTGSKLPLTSDIQLRPLVLLDLLLNGSSEPLESIPSQRQNFLMQALVRMIADEPAGLPLRTLALKLLEPIVEAIRDLYGEHWEQILQSLVTILQANYDLAEDLPVLQAALRLYGRIRSLATLSEVNEDLVEAWKAAEGPLEEALLNCLDSFDHTADEINQPRRITAELLQRQLSHVNTQYDTRLYHFLRSTENSVLGAAYDLLHRSIPPAQEQISLDIALGERVAQLPTELLELLLDKPQASGTANMPLRRSYLLCWMLVFDHFPKASYKLQAAYAADIKESTVLGGLLDLICEIGRITSNRPLDASKSDMTSFKVNAGETEEQEEQRLATYLYYCCLLYLPGLTRSWFIEQKNRVKSPLEGWTQRYFAPTLIAAAATTVSEWAQGQSQDEGDSPVAVKTSLSGSETVASIAVDPESPPISLAVSLPKTYPLDSPTVSSRTRVGVSEKNWQSWLRTIQIIIFSTGSIIEGLVAFRRNVQGALKGQSECAICYSIIGTDMQTPNKRCGTCRNTFHGVCLFRWFKSSNSSSCPLCRNNFNYA